MKKFEYKIVESMFPIAFYEIRGLGDDGWELCCIESMADFRLHYFKREMQEAKV